MAAHRRLRDDPDTRMEYVVIGADPSGFPDADFARLDPAGLPGWVERLRVAEAATRQLRLRLEAIAAGNHRTCLVCGSAVIGRADRVYCSAVCRQREHRNA